MASQMVITNAGLNALVDAQNGVTEAIEITKIGLTAAEFVMAPTLIALPGEFKRLASVSGTSAGSNIIHYNVQDASADAYEVRGLGAYLADGTLFAVYAQEEAIFAKSDVVTFLLSFDVAFVNDVETAITFGDATFVFPPASEEARGTVKIATQAKVDDGADNESAVTPLTLAVRLASAIAAEASARSQGDTMLAAQVTAAAILAKLLSIDGSGSGLDADLLDGQQGAFYRDAVNLTGTVTIPVYARLEHRPGEGYFRLGSYGGSYGNGACRIWWDENNKRVTFTDATSLAISGGIVWHSGNDGAGSGLDADLLDGQHANYFTNIAARLGFTPVQQGTGAGQGSNTIKIGWSGSRLKATVDVVDQGNMVFDQHIADVWRASNDGAGSGLDADMLDGYHASSFLREIASNAGSNGYKRLADGWIIQWVTVGCSASGASSFSWPIAFPNAVFAAVPGGRQGLNYSGSYSAYLTNVSTTGGNAYGNNGGGASSTVNIIAIGN